MYHGKFDGIDGENTDVDHKDWIGILSVSHGLQQMVSEASRTGGRSTSGAVMGDINLMKEMDKATPDLNIYCATGKHIPTVVLECCLESDAKHVYFRYTLTDVIISSMSVSIGGNNGKPTESLTLNAGTIKWEYTQIDDTGSAGATIDRTYSMIENKKV